MMTRNGNATTKAECACLRVAARARLSVKLGPETP